MTKEEWKKGGKVRLKSEPVSATYIADVNNNSLRIYDVCFYDQFFDKRNLVIPVGVI